METAQSLDVFRDRQRASGSIECFQTVHKAEVKVTMDERTRYGSIRSNERYESIPENGNSGHR